MSTTIVYLATQNARALEEQATPQRIKSVQLSSLRGVTFGLSRFNAAMTYLLANGGKMECKGIRHGLVYSTYSDVRLSGPKAAVEHLLASASS